MLYNPTVSPQPKLPSSCPKLPSSPNEATVVRDFGQICLPSSRGESFGDYCTKTRKGTSLSFWCKVYHASVFLCYIFERDRWSQRSTRRQKLLEASGRVVAILTTVASCGCPQCSRDVLFVMSKSDNECPDVISMMFRITIVRYRIFLFG